nr:hypothetical protein BaRGS_026013 [Batillaria attramentaria]
MTPEHADWVLRVTIPVGEAADTDLDDVGLHMDHRDDLVTDNPAVQTVLRVTIPVGEAADTDLDDVGLHMDRRDDLVTDNPAVQTDFDLQLYAGGGQISFDGQRCLTLTLIIGQRCLTLTLIIGQRCLTLTLIIGQRCLTLTLIIGQRCLTLTLIIGQRCLTLTLIIGQRCLTLTLIIGQRCLTLTLIIGQRCLTLTLIIGQRCLTLTLIIGQRCLTLTLIIGQRYIFSFHNQSALPQRLPDGKWNCSVPHWADFQQHFLFISLDGKGSFTIYALGRNSTCPETHFRCPGDGYCMPVYVRCNDVYDCPGKEDEAACDSYTCPGFYRCRKSRVYFLMGVYLTVIGVADRLYRGNYLWEDTAWKKSVASTIPLLPMTSHWQFYGQTGICIPLPITRRQFSGQDYAFGVMIVLNFVLFVLIAVGQILIYCSIQTNSMSDVDPARRSRDLAIARRLFAIVMSDFMCWFPLGLAGILASLGIPISGEVNVAMAIFVLPFNSAINPFLYTFNVIVEKRRVKQEELLRQRLMAEINRKIATREEQNKI